MIDRVLIVGYGSIGQRHLRLVRDALPQADIRILRHRPCDAIPDLANGCYDSLDAACAFAPQAAVIASPAPFHVASARALAAVGCHLLVEKPLAATEDGVPALLRLVRERHLTLQVGYNLRFLPSLIEFRTRIQAGAIGRVLSIRCEIGQSLPTWRPGADYRQGVSARRGLGGGVLLELSHELDYLRWIFGEVVWVTAWLGRQSDMEIDVEDTAHLTLGFAPAASGPSPVAALSLDCIRHDTARQCTAIGEQGSLRWNGLTGEISLYPAGGTAWQSVYRHTHQRDDSYRVQWQHFQSYVQSGCTPLVTGEDGLAVLRIVAAARQSAAAQGARVRVDSQAMGLSA